MNLVTYKGNKIDYLNITKHCIDMDDIIHSLPRINRFIGHSGRAYSVAEHTLWCWLMAKKLGYSTRLILLTLIHDFSEAYTGDCPTPLKRLLPEFKVIEGKFEVAISEYLKVAPATEEEHKLVKRIDSTMLAIEMRDLTLHDFTEYVNDSTYEEVLADTYNYKIHEQGESEETLQGLIREVFHEVYQEYQVEELLKDEEV
jgi:uncharacterized protein